MLWLGLLILSTFQAEKPAPVPGLPAAAGVYFRQSDAQWEKMDAAVLATMKSKGMGNYLETDGYMNLDVTVTYIGAQAKLQIPAALPRFFVRGAGSPKDAMIVRLSKAKDTRFVHTDTSHATVDNRAGFRKDDIQSVTITVYSDNSFSVTAERELKAGEYALVFGFANVAHDFSITRVSK